MNTRQFFFTLSVIVVLFGLVAIALGVWWYYFSNQAPGDDPYDRFDTTQPEEYRQHDALDALDGEESAIQTQEDHDRVVETLEALSGNTAQDSTEGVGEVESETAIEDERYIDTGGAVPHQSPDAPEEPTEAEQKRLEALEALSG